MAANPSLGPTVHILNDSHHISSSISSEIIKLANKSVQDHGQFNVAFSGGSLPKIVGAGLTSTQYQSDVSWNKWHIYYADERCVELKSSDSNHAEVTKQFLDLLPNNSIPQKNLHTLSEKFLSNPKAAADDYAETLKQAVQHKNEANIPQLDLILLGMVRERNNCLSTAFYQQFHAHFTHCCPLRCMQYTFSVSL
jgi:6-phosphogluconolactonase